MTYFMEDMQLILQFLFQGLIFWLKLLIDSFHIFHFSFWRGGAHPSWRIWLVHVYTLTQWPGGTSNSHRIKHLSGLVMSGKTGGPLWNFSKNAAHHGWAAKCLSSNFSHVKQLLIISVNQKKKYYFVGQYGYYYWMGQVDYMGNG